MKAKNNFVLSVVLSIAVILMAVPMAGCDTKFIPSAADQKHCRTCRPNSWNSAMPGRKSRPIMWKGASSIR